MSLRRLLTGRMARAELLALAMILMAFPGLSAQVAQGSGADPLEIDGVIDEPFYQRVPPITEFVQIVPEVDGEPSELTEVWIGFDDDNVYVSAKVWDSAGPDGWIANEMRRDSRQLTSNDHFGVFLDTFYDRRNGVAFSGNAIGGFSDLQITNEGNINRDWNPIWETRSALFDGGWSIEMAIPFKSLSYRPGREQVWGIRMRRTVMRRNEWIFLRALPLSVSSSRSLQVGGGKTPGASGAGPTCSTARAAHRATAR